MGPRSAERGSVGSTVDLSHWGQASMGPRSAERGSAVDWSESGASPCFNGATFG